VRNDINKLKEAESTYQVTQTEIDKRPRLEKLQNIFTVKERMKTAGEAMAEMLEDKNVNLTVINYLIYAGATVITEVNGKGSYKSETQSPEKPL
jgi:hypothetical protein